MKENFTRTKISDIARLAGVSAGTVDRVIHNRGEVAVKTREKILQIISELNYEPDILASTLASKKEIRFASLIPLADAGNPFWISPNEGINDAWEEIKHFGIILEKNFFSYHDKKSFASQLEKMIERKPAGIVMAPVFTKETANYMQTLQQLKIPVVFLNAQMEKQTNISFVGQDPFHSGMVAASLMDFGLNDDAEIYIINIISKKGGNNHILTREEGFRAYYSNPVKNSNKKLITIDINTDDAHELESKLLQYITAGIHSKKQKGIFVTNSKVFHVAEYLEKNALNNYMLLGYDLLEQNQQWLKKGIIQFLISQKPKEQGYKSIMTLFNYMVMKKQVTRNQFLPIDIITKENIDFYINH